MSKELQTEVLGKGHMIQRSAYRAGQRDMLMKINSIVNTYCLGTEEAETCLKEIKEYCEFYSHEAALDKHITDDIIKRIE